MKIKLLNGPNRELPPLRKILGEIPLSGLALPSAKGEMCTESAFSRAWESYISCIERELNGVAWRWADEDQRKAWRHFPLRCHDLRHTFATLLYNAGVDVKTAQRWMGHADVMVTMRIYTHLSDARQNEAIAAAERYFSSQEKSGSNSGSKSPKLTPENL